MSFPNLYVAEGGQQTVAPAMYFIGGENLTYTVTVADTSVATAEMTAEGKLVVKGLTSGQTAASIKASDGSVNDFIITVRSGAAGNGWL